MLARKNTFVLTSHTVVALLLIVVFLTGSAFVAYAQPDVAAVPNMLSPRYLLVQGRHEVTAKINTDTAVFEKDSVFRIDTATGDTWVYEEIFIDGKPMRHWNSITLAIDAEPTQ